MEMEPINGLLCVITKFDYVFINKNNEVISRTVNEQLTFEYRVIDYPRYVAERFLTNDMYLHMDGKKYKIDKNTSKYTQILCGDVFMLSCKFNNRLLISSFSGVHFFDQFGNETYFQPSCKFITTKEYLILTDKDTDKSKIYKKLNPFHDKPLYRFLDEDIKTRLLLFLLINNRNNRNKRISSDVMYNCIIPLIIIKF
jgi:hypothetical protein